MAKRRTIVRVQMALNEINTNARNQNYDVGASTILLKRGIPGSVLLICADLGVFTRSESRLPPPKHNLMLYKSNYPSIDYEMAKMVSEYPTPYGRSGNCFDGISYRQNRIAQTGRRSVKAWGGLPE